MIPIIGGKLDGSKSPVRLPQLTEGDETYMLIEFGELVGDKKVRREFYMLTGGPTVAEAMRIFKERAKAHLWD
jgi:hypothetical protein